jgi:hypothetical protein
MFKGNAISTVYSGHYFYIAKLQQYGLAVMSEDDFKEFKNRPVKIGGATSTGEDDDEESSESEGAAFQYAYDFSAHADIWAFLTSIGITSWKYDLAQTDGSFTATTISEPDIKKLITYTDDSTYKERRDDVTGDEKTIRQIQNSPYGCIYGINSLGSTLGTSSAVRIYFHKRHNERKDRVPAFKSSTLFAAHPRRHSGARYAHKQSKGNSTTANEHAGDVGYVNITEQDYASMVAAPLKLIYNHNIGVWETGGAFLVSLLEDVDGAEIIASDLDTGNLENREPKDFYGAQRVNDMSNFTTGLAAPVQVQNKNPHAFGPNFIRTGHTTNDDGDFNKQYRVEKIRVVNRSANNFTRGEVAIAHPIDGENILVKLGESVVEVRPPAWEGHWEFGKFLASSDDWFRTFNGEIIKESEMPEFIWRKIYAATTETRSLANGYFQDTIFNQTGDGIPGGNLTGHDHAWGGTPDAQKTHVGRVNTAIGVGSSTNVALDSIEYRDIPVFWGPVFPLGYKKSKVTMGEKSYPTEQLPAEIATLGTRADDGSPIYDYDKVLKAINIGSASDLRSARFDLLTLNEPQASGLSLTPSNENQIQFSFLSAELYGHKDENTEIIDAISNNSQKRGRNFYANIANHTGYPKGTDLFGGHSFTTLAGTVQEAYGHLYNDAPTDYAGPKYDAYVTKEAAFYKPNGSYVFFGDDGPFLGAGAVGLTAARRGLFKRGGFDLNVDTSQTFGTQGVFYGGGGLQGPQVTILGGMFAWSSDPGGRVISGTTVVWGSASDSIYSFGTGAAHVDVWDGWPREDTAWLPQYATPIHFNANAEAAETEEKTVPTWTGTEYEDYTINVYPITLDIDYRIPTYGNKVDYTPDNSDSVLKKWKYGEGKDGQSVEEDDKIYTSTVLRPEAYWNATFHRRGKVLTGYGYFWDKTLIGVDKASKSIITAGTDYEVDDILAGDKGVLIKVTAVDSDGGITGFDIAKSKDTNNTTFSKKRTLVHPVDGDLNWDEIGEGFEPNNFPVSMTLDSQGDGAVIQFANGLVQSRPMCDHPPQRRSSMTRVSLPSTNGQRRVYGTRSVSISVEDNGQDNLQNEVTESYTYKRPGYYEVFTYCHNDIGIALHEDPDATTGYQMHNYITVTFS